MEREEVIRNLHACLLCAKGGVSLDSLSQDYTTLVGERIPFRKLGFPTITAFLQTVPGIRASNRRGQCFVEVLPSQETAHLAKLVSQQKTSTSKSKKRAKVSSSYSPRKPLAFQIQRSYPNAARQINSAPKIPNVTYQQPISLPVRSTMQENKDPRTIRNGGPPSYMAQARQFASAAPKPLILEKQPQYQQSTSPQFRHPIQPPIQPPLQPLIKPLIQPLIKPPVQSLVKPSPLIQLPVHSQIQPARQPPIQPQFNQPIQSQYRQPAPPQYQQRPETLQVSINNVSSAPVSKRAVVQLPTTSDPRVELAARVKVLNLPEPEYNVLPTKIKNTKYMSVFAQVKIGTQSYKSYPREAQTPEEAEKIAAEVALQDITEKYGMPDNCNQMTDKNVVMQRILSMVKGHANGVFMQHIPVLYKQEYKEVIPTDWETIVRNCSNITLERGVNDSFILRPYTAPPPSPRTPEKDNSISFFRPVSPGTLRIPDESPFIVSVTYVKSTIEVYARLVDDTDDNKIGTLMADMAKHYGEMPTPTKPPLIQIGNYYAILHDGTWSRVKCVNHNPDNGMVSVLFIDFGDEDEVDYVRLQLLDKKFCSLPCQAFRLKLLGLEDFSDCEFAVPEIARLLLDQGFYIVVHSRDTIDDKPCVTVTFYDTSGEDDVNLNTALLSTLTAHLENAPQLDVNRKVFEVFICHVENNGDVYIQIQSDNMKRLVKLLNRLVESLPNPDPLKPAAVTNINLGEMYFVFVDDSWRRGRVLKAISINQYKVLLIDFGNTVTVDIKNMMVLREISEIAARFPPQALKVHLNNIDRSMFDERMVARFKELAPVGEPLLAKVVSCSANEVPTVELLKRIPPNNLLASINTNLMYGDELERSQGDDNNNIKKPRTCVDSVSSSSSLNDNDNLGRVLKPPMIPPTGEFFDVHVTMAAHPGNFTVRPFRDGPALDFMMNRLHEVYSTYDGPIPTPGSVREGQMYAVEHRGGWYRISVSGIITHDMVTVYFCDYGDMSVQHLSKLRPLKPEFYELPYQAIKARLVGVRPINGDWSVQDSTRFQELVLEQNLVSMIVETEPNGVSPTDVVLGLKLINVSTCEDICIHQILVDEGRAVSTDA